MSLVFGSKEALQVLFDLERGDTAPEVGLEVLASIFFRNLNELSVAVNTQNALQIAKVISAELFPDDPLNKIVVRWIEEGRVPSFSKDLPEKYSVYRACSVFASSVATSWSPDAPKEGGKILDQYIEQQGYLPDPNEVVE